jgi:hypothetical protein
MFTSNNQKGDFSGKILIKNEEEIHHLILQRTNKKKGLVRTPTSDKGHHQIL